MTVSSIANRPNLKYRIKVYIKDNNGTWVDFTDRQSAVNTRGVDRVIKIAPIKYTVEKDLGALQTTTQNIVLDNSDLFFNKPFPSTLKAINGVAASFTATKNNTQSIIYRHQIRISVIIYNQYGMISSADDK